MTARRLTKTLVEQTIRETDTRDLVSKVGDTLKQADHRHLVFVALHDTYDDPRAESPAANTLIAALEEQGWVVGHVKGHSCSRLTVSEPSA